MEFYRICHIKKHHQPYFFSFSWCLQTIFPLCYYYFLPNHVRFMISLFESFELHQRRISRQLSYYSFPSSFLGFVVANALFAPCPFLVWGLANTYLGQSFLYYAIKLLHICTLNPGASFATEEVRRFSATYFCNMQTHTHIYEKVQDPQFSTAWNK